MAVVFEKTKMLTDTVFHYCPCLLYTSRCV